jgi:hypothetical protein
MNTLQMYLEKRAKDEDGFEFSDPIKTGLKMTGAKVGMGVGTMVPIVAMHAGAPTPEREAMLQKLIDHAKENKLVDGISTSSKDLSAPSRIMESLRSHYNPGTKRIFSSRDPAVLAHELGHASQNMKAVIPMQMAGKWGIPLSLAYTLYSDDEEKSKKAAIAGTAIGAPLVATEAHASLAGSNLIKQLGGGRSIRPFTGVPSYAGFAALPLLAYYLKHGSKPKDTKENKEIKSGDVILPYPNAAKMGALSAGYEAAGMGTPPFGVRHPNMTHGLWGAAGAVGGAIPGGILGVLLAKNKGLGAGLGVNIGGLAGALGLPMLMNYRRNKAESAKVKEALGKHKPDKAKIRAALKALTKENGTGGFLLDQMNPGRATYYSAYERALKSLLNKGKLDASLSAEDMAKGFGGSALGTAIATGKQSLEKGR